MKTDLLKDKRILVVDDERDVLEVIEELLPMSEIVMASNFEEGKDIYMFRRPGARDAGL